MLPEGGTFTFEENRVLGVTLVLFVEVIFPGKLPYRNFLSQIQLTVTMQLH